MVPLMPVHDFAMPELVTTVKSAFGPALSLLSECRKREIIVATPDRKGDFRPIVFCFLNGSQLVGNLEQGIHDFRSIGWKDFISIVTRADADFTTLAKIYYPYRAPHPILALEDLQNEASKLIKFLGWRAGDDYLRPLSAWMHPKKDLDNQWPDGLPPPPPDILIPDMETAAAEPSKNKSPGTDEVEHHGQ